MNDGNRRVLFRPGDAVVTAVVVILILTAAAAVYSPGGEAMSAVVTADSGEYVLPLSEDTVLALAERGISLAVTVKNGQARFEHSSCPDGTCVHAGWLSIGGSAAACLPAGVMLRIISRHGADQPDVVI